MTGKFIVIEGLDATGKSTLVDKLAKSLNAILLRCPPRLETPGLIDGDATFHTLTIVRPYSGVLTIEQRISLRASRPR